MAFRLSCSVQNYAWGKLGSDSAVAQLSKQANHSFQQVDESQPYAELWMGTHPCGQSFLFDDPKTSLLNKIREYPDLNLGKAVASKYGNDLPFLFKVLSVGKALSIQAHPDLTLAKKLHLNAPTVYKDGNHKPEMCIALTTFEGLCGFRVFDEISTHLESFPELSKLTGVSKISSSEELKHIFAVLMKSDDQTVKDMLKQLVNRLSSDGVSFKQGSIEELLLRLNQQYPGDVGCFCALLLNYVILKPGEAMFLAANEPHAYLSGDCVECMATSDNVIRAGLTPKLKDVETLVNMLTYKTYKREQILMKPQSYGQDGHSRLFKSPVKEFSVIETVVSGNSVINLPPLEGPSIIIAVEGEGVMQCQDVKNVLQKGYVYFIPPNIEMKLSASKSLKCYRGFCDE